MERITVFISGILFVLFLFVFTTIEFVDSTSKITATHNFNNGKIFETRTTGGTVNNISLGDSVSMSLGRSIKTGTVYNISAGDHDYIALARKVTSADHYCTDCKIPSAKVQGN